MSELHVSWYINDVLLLDHVFPDYCCSILGLGSGYWSYELNSNDKMQGFFLLQGDKYHPNDVLVVMALEGLTGISCMTGTLSWSSSIVVWDERHRDDVWGDMGVDKRHLGDG